MNKTSRIFLQPHTAVQIVAGKRNQMSEIEPFPIA